MKYLLYFSLLLITPSSFAQLNDSIIRDLKGGRIANDSSYVYWLPYQKGNKYLFVQGANSSFSHKDELSFDFKMKSGSEICAARAGTIIEAKSDSDIGGLKEEFLNDGNHILIQHEDGSIAKYWHLKLNGVIVKVGDKVEKGQLIGYSGNTGYTAFPHLHFQLIDVNGMQILPRFQTKRGVLYLRPGHKYKSAI